MNRIRESWKALDEDLKNYFFGKSLLLMGMLMATGLVYLFVPVKSLAVMFLLIFLCYGAWILYQFIEGMTGKIYLYEGICVKKDDKRFDMRVGIRKTMPLYGRTTAVIRVKDNGEGSEDCFSNVIIPVGYSYDLQKGYTVRAYGSKNGLIMKNPNTFSLPNPILIRVSKTNYDDAAEKEIS